MELNPLPTKSVQFSGLFDLQVNGFAGVDFNDPRLTEDTALRAIDALRATGVTRFLPTLISSSFEDFARCAKFWAELKHPAVAGIHMEGPYISAEDGPRGAHEREHIMKASLDDFQRRQGAACGQIRLVTLAPEIPGAIALTEYLVENEIVVSIGHTNASPQQIRDIIKAGATLSTHLGNGCASALPRHPNLIWEQLAADELFASFIVDGHHLSPATVKAMILAKRPDRSILVTDAMAAAGCAPGEYELAGQRVVLSKEGRVAPPGKPWLAGSALSLERAIGNTVKYTRLPLEQVLPMASAQAAACVGLETFGSVTADWDAKECRLTNLKISEPSNGQEKVL